MSFRKTLLVICTVLLELMLCLRAIAQGPVRCGCGNAANDCGREPNSADSLTAQSSATDIDVGRR